MPRIKLAGWYSGKKPGDELEVDDVQLKALRRDGLVAEVVQSAPEPAPAVEETPPAPEPALPRRKR